MKQIASSWFINIQGAHAQQIESTDDEHNEDDLSILFNIGSVL